MSEVVNEAGAEIVPFKNYIPVYNWWTITNNFYVGCEKVSLGCKFCYMYREQERYKKDPKDIHRTTDPTFYKITKQKIPHCVFVNSYSDFWIKVLRSDPNDPEKMIDIAKEWRRDAFKVMRERPDDVFIIPTKRVDLIMENLPEDWGAGYPNVWLGVSVENQATAEARIPLLAQIPAAVRFLSCEPLLEFISFTGLPMESINWIIVGGESGYVLDEPNAKPEIKWRYRPTDHNAIKWIIDQAARLRIPVFMKQLGTYLAKHAGLKDTTGSDMSEPNFPNPLKVRQFPMNMDKYFKVEGDKWLNPKPVKSES